MVNPQRLIITGASGFIGSHVVETALAHGHEIVAVGRSEASVAKSSWVSSVRFVTADIFSPAFDPDCLGKCNALLHLAWPDLSNFKSEAHLEQHLPANVSFLTRLLKTGLSKVLIAGTCLEYGLINGELREAMRTRPTVPYAQAKDALRVHLAAKMPPDATMIWARLFYMHGPGQNPKSILALLDAAIDRGDSIFPMSKGEQLRDYLPVNEIASRLLKLLEATNSSGIYNICSGQPISILDLVQQRIAERGASIKPQLGKYPYPDYEAMAFWGSGSRFQREAQATDE